jgi:hypothetical protein
MRTRLLAMAMGLVSGCWYQPFDPEGHACAGEADCLEGYRCELSRCVRGEAADAGGDADLDAAPSDDARPDAHAPTDVGTDALRIDAGADALLGDAGEDAAAARDAGRDAPDDDVGAGDAGAGEDARVGQDAAMGQDAAVGQDAAMGQDAASTDDAG